MDPALHSPALHRFQLSSAVVEQKEKPNDGDQMAECVLSVVDLEIRIHLGVISHNYRRIC